MKNWMVLQWAKEAGFVDTTDEGVWITDGYWTEEMERFADLVARHERDQIVTTLSQIVHSHAMASKPRKK